MNDIIDRYILTTEDEELEEVVRVPNVKKTLSSIGTQLSLAKDRMKLSKAKLQQRLVNRRITKVKKKERKAATKKIAIKRRNKKTGAELGKNIAKSREELKKYNERMKSAPKDVIGRKEFMRKLSKEMLLK